MKVIDLLNKIANGEKLPKKIKLLCPTLKEEFRIVELNDDNYYEYSDGSCISVIFGKLELNDEVEIIEEKKEDNFTGMKFFSNGKEFMSFDTSEEVKCRDDVEIEEDNKIEKLNIQLGLYDENKVNFYTANNLECDISYKINELIDEVNKLKENK